MRNNTAKKPMSLYWFIERILSAITVLGLACLGIGFPLFIVGRTFNDSTMARAGAYILLIGIVLTGTRIFYWIAEEIVGQGLESMAK
jgi:uncharacterized membrane protein